MDSKVGALAVSADPVAAPTPPAGRPDSTRVLGRTGSSPPAELGRSATLDREGSPQNLHHHEALGHSDLRTGEQALTLPRSTVGTMKSAPFDYHRPATVDEATELLTENWRRRQGARRRPEPRADARAAPRRVRPPGRHRPTDGFTGIERRDDALWIGAGAAEATVETDPVVAGSPLLARATPLIGHLQIRNRGAVGGSIAHADPAAEYPTVALALEPRWKPPRRGADACSPPPTSSPACGAPRWSRTSCSSASAARCGPVGAARGPPSPGATATSPSRRAVGVELDDDDRVRRSAIALIGLGSTAVRATAAEAAIVGRPIRTRHRRARPPRHRRPRRRPGRPPPRRRTARTWGRHGRASLDRGHGGEQ